LEEGKRAVQFIGGNWSMDSLKKFRDRLRITIILYTFCERANPSSPFFGTFRTEIKIQALDFLLRYPDFLSIELMDLIDGDRSIDQNHVKELIMQMYSAKEPIIRVEEMEKFFHGAYESLDEVIAYLISVGFVKYESKKRVDGNTYDKIYNVTHDCALRIDSNLKLIPSVQWYFDRCQLIKKYFNRFSGSELKERQYRYAEYSNISYKSHIQSIDARVKVEFSNRFNESLA
jgi:hypothetical protein